MPGSAAQYHGSCPLDSDHDLDCSSHPSSLSLISLSGKRHPIPALLLLYCLISSFITSTKFPGSIEIDRLSYSCSSSAALLMISNVGDLSISSVPIESSILLSFSASHSSSSLLPSSMFFSSSVLFSASNLFSNSCR